MPGRRELHMIELATGPLNTVATHYQGKFGSELGTASYDGPRSTRFPKTQIIPYKPIVHFG